MIGTGRFPKDPLELEFFVIRMLISMTISTVLLNRLLVRLRKWRKQVLSNNVGQNIVLNFFVGRPPLFPLLGKSQDPDLSGEGCNLSGTRLRGGLNFPSLHGIRRGEDEEVV